MSECACVCVCVRVCVCVCVYVGCVCVWGGGCTGPKPPKSICKVACHNLPWLWGWGIGIYIMDFT